MNQDKVGTNITPAPENSRKRSLQSSHSTSFDQYPVGAENTYARTYDAPPSEYGPSTPQSIPHVYDSAELQPTYPATYFGDVVSSASRQVYSQVGTSTPTAYDQANYRASPQVSHRPATTGPYNFYPPAACSYPTTLQTPPVTEFPPMSRDRWQPRPLKPSTPTYPNAQYAESPQTITISDSPGSPQRPFCCDLCTLSFNRQHDLKRHRETHTGEKPFLCNGGCGKTFTRKDALKRHQVRVVLLSCTIRNLTTHRSSKTAEI